MGIQSILSGITGIESGSKNTAAEFRTLLTDMTETLSASTEITGATISINGGEVMDRIPNSKDFQLFGNQSSTGIIEYGGLSVNGIDNTKFDLGNIKGWIINNVMNPTIPSINYIDFLGVSGITLTYLTTNIVTYIGLSGNTVNDIVQSTSPFTHTERREMLVLGVVVHSNNTNINVINDAPVLGLNPTMQFYDLTHGLGFFNIGEGNRFKPNGANLNIDKSEGEIFASSSNYITENKNPHIRTLTSLNSPTFRYRLQDSTEYGDRNDIDPNNYDNNGILTAVPQNKFTIQRVTCFTSNSIRIQYGQHIYDSIDDAEAFISTEEYISEVNMKENGLLRAFIIVKQGATKLNEPIQSKFIECNHWGDAHDTVVGNVHRTDILNHTSTTLRSGGIISINNTTTPITFDISSGNGVVTDNTTDPSNPSFTEVNWETITGVTVDNVATHTGSNIYINSLGEVVQFPNTFESNGAEGRLNIALGGVGHTDNINVTSVFNIPVHNLSPINVFSDLVKAIGPFSISGNRISHEPNTLKLNKTSGRSYYFGSNYQNDKTNPDLVSLTGLTTPPLVFATGEKIIGFGSTDVDTQQYDNNGLGVLSTLTNLNGSVAHRIWHEPSSNFLIFQYGQKAYKDLPTARDGFISEEYVVPPGLASGAYLVAVLVTDKSINVSNLNDAIFIPQGKFSGSGGGGSIDTLQTAYTNSTNPEIVTDNIRGSVDLRVGSGNNTDNLITFQNTSGTTTASITGEGVITGNFIISDGISVPTSATDIGVAGTIIYDADFIYTCIATNTWKRSPLSTWV